MTVFHALLASAASAMTVDVRRFDVPSQSARTAIPPFAHPAGIWIFAPQAITDRLNGAGNGGTFGRMFTVGVRKTF